MKRRRAATSSPGVSGQTLWHAPRKVRRGARGVRQQMVQRAGFPAVAHFELRQQRRHRVVGREQSVVFQHGEQRGRHRLGDRADVPAIVDGHRDAGAPPALATGGRSDKPSVGHHGGSHPGEPRVVLQPGEVGLEIPLIALPHLTYCHVGPTGTRGQDRRERCRGHAYPDALPTPSRHAIPPVTHLFIENRRPLKHKIVAGPQGPARCLTGFTGQRRPDGPCPPGSRSGRRAGYGTTADGSMPVGRDDAPHGPDPALPRPPGRCSPTPEPCTPNPACRTPPAPADAHPTPSRTTPPTRTPCCPRPGRPRRPRSVRTSAPHRALRAAFRQRALVRRARRLVVHRPAVLVALPSSNRHRRPSP